MRASVAAALVLALVPGGSPAAQQSAAPLQKSDVVRMLTSGGMSKSEIAQIIGRNCLSFTPTARDRQDLQSVGADAEILRRVDECARRRVAARVTVTPREPAAVAGGEAVLEVAASRGGGAGGGPLAAARVTLRASGLPDLVTVTDAEGRATLRFPAGERAGTRRLTVSVAGAGAVAVTLQVAPGEPVAAQVEPAHLSTASHRVSVAISDRFGNRVPGRAVRLEPVGLVATSDARGEVTFTVPPAVLGRAGREGLTIMAGERRLAGGRVTVSVPASVSAERTGFIAGGSQSAVVGNLLPEPLVFEVRDATGAPVAGQTVAWRAVNARPSAESAVTDSGGRARVRVAIGPRTAPAVVTARVGEIEKQVTFVPRPGPAARLMVRCAAATLERRIDFAPDTTFTLDVSAQDAFGNPVRVAGLRAAVGDHRLLRVREATADSLSGRVVVEARRPGVTAFAVMASGLRENFTVSVLSAPPAGAPCG